MTDNMNNDNNGSNKRTTALSVVLGVALVLVTAGCNGSGGEHKQVTHGEAFTTDDTPRSIDKFANMQIASGARNDATLNAVHFDGNQLNSLGRDKLRAMLKDDDACEPLTVYLNLKGTGDVKSRHEAVTAFLLDEGLLESQVELKDGSNPNSGAPAIRGIKAIAATDSAGAEAGGSSGGVAATAAGAGK